jgi:hypothetical protein
VSVSIRRLVDPPEFTLSRFGLLSVAEIVENAEDPHWRNGVEFQPQFCGTALTTAAVCVTGGATKPAVADGLTTRGATPFAVHAWLNCSPIGYSADEWRRLTVAALVNNEAAAVEAVFTSGVVPGDTVYPHLAANTAVNDSAGVGQVVNLQTAATVVVTGAGVDVVEGVGLLEEAMGGCYGGVPTLHVPRRAAATLAARGLLVEEGNRLRTKTGSLVAAGTGYTGPAPDGSALAPGVRWMYATGAVKVWRSTVELTGSNPADWIGRARNDQVLVAERVYVIGWDCCLFAVPVQFGGDVTGVVGTPG